LIPNAWGVKYRAKYPEYDIIVDKTLAVSLKYPVLF
jgi:hypothetical protein